MLATAKSDLGLLGGFIAVTGGGASLITACSSKVRARNVRPATKFPPTRCTNKSLATVCSAIRKTNGHPRTLITTSTLFWTKITTPVAPLAMRAMTTAAPLVTAVTNIHPTTSGASTLKRASANLTTAWNATAAPTNTISRVAAGVLVSVAESAKTISLTPVQQPKGNT